MSLNVLLMTAPLVFVVRSLEEIVSFDSFVRAHEGFFPRRYARRPIFSGAVALLFLALCVLCT